MPLLLFVDVENELSNCLLKIDRRLNLILTIHHSIYSCQTLNAGYNSLALPSSGKEYHSETYSGPVLDTANPDTDLLAHPWSHHRGSLRRSPPHGDPPRRAPRAGPPPDPSPDLPAGRQPQRLQEVVDALAVLLRGAPPPGPGPGTPEGAGVAREGGAVGPGRGPGQASATARPPTSSWVQASL